MKRFPNKKGLDYIDWTLSMGLFLIVVVALFVFLKPGVQPTYSGENLLNIIETKFMEETATELKQKPLFVKKLKDKYGSSLEAKINVKITNKWQFKKIEPATSKGFDIIFNNKKIVLDCNAIDCTQKFTLKLLPVGQQQEEPIVEIKCIPDDPTYCDALLGATETFEGVSNTLINKIKEKEYKTLKKEWKYPEQEEFAIYIKAPPIYSESLKLIGGEEAGPQTNIFVKELKYWIIKGTTRYPATISIRVW